MLENYDKILKTLKINSHFRNIKNFTNKDEKYIYFGDKKLINFSSNNYLSFADNETITQKLALISRLLSKISLF